MSCESSFPEPQLLSRLGSREVFTDHSHSTLSDVPVVPTVVSLTSFLFSFWSHCGDQPDCCSQCLALSFDRCDRFLAQGKSVYHLITIDCVLSGVFLIDLVVVGFAGFFDFPQGSSGGKTA